jgi:hypothetical protein
MKITIITPCCRPEHLPKIYESLNFEYIHKWIIVYDSSKGREYERRYAEHKNIIEADYHHLGISGNDQRNFGLNFVSKGFVYFLDDDNIVHPDFWKVLPTLNEKYMYSWDQEKPDGSLATGGIPVANGTDTAMCIVPYSLMKGITWVPHLRCADGLFLSSIYEQSPDYHVYIPRVLCYYNKLT